MRIDPNQCGYGKPIHGPAWRGLALLAGDFFNSMPKDGEIAHYGLQQHQNSDLFVIRGTKRRSSGSAAGS